MQEKFVPLDAVLNYIPTAVRELDEDQTLMKYAYQGMRHNYRSLASRYAFETCLVELKNHKGRLPGHVEKIACAIYYVTKPGESLSLASDLVVQNTNFLDEDDCRVTIFQANAFVQYAQHGSLMHYKGQNPELLMDNCPNFFCTDCNIGYSVDRTMSSITVDECYGYAVVLYRTLIRDANGTILIPDVSVLHQAMSYYAQAQHWLNRAVRKEANANQMFTQMQTMAHNMFQEARSLNIAKNFNYERFFQFMMGRWPLKRHVTASGWKRNSFYNR